MSYRAIFFFSALYLYAFFGSPTPDNPGIVEALIGLLLVLAAGGGIWRSVFSVYVPRWKTILSVIFAYGVSVQILTGLTHNNDPGIVLRDVVAFLFFLLPLFFYDLIARQGRSFLTAAIIVIGICFSLRALIPVYGLYEAPEELLYLANSPLVLLSALYLSMRVLFDIYERRVGVRTMLFSVLAVIPFAAMLIDVQRAPMIAVTVSITFGILYILYFRPKRGAVIIAAVVLAGFFLLPVIGEIGHEIASKTMKVGLNMRVEELRAVVAAVSGDIYTALFGLGWGGRFAAPSVGGLHVSYTHSLLSYFLLKGGIVGLSLILLFCWQAGREIFAVFCVRPMTGVLLFWPFIIPVLFYASHKSLDFGVVLLFIFICSVEVRALRGHGKKNSQDVQEFDPALLPKGAA